MSSVLPPPISSSSTCRIVRSNRGVQPSRASWTSSAGEMISMESPVSSLTRSMNAWRFSARRQASVATAQ